MRTLPLTPHRHNFSSNLRSDPLSELPAKRSRSGRLSWQTEVLGCEREGPNESGQAAARRLKLMLPNPHNSPPSSAQRTVHQTVSRSSVRQAFCSADFLWPESHRWLRFFLLRLSSSICDTAVTRLKVVQIGRAHV